MAGASGGTNGLWPQSTHIDGRSFGTQKVEEKLSCEPKIRVGSEKRDMEGTKEGDKSPLQP